MASRSTSEKEFRQKNHSPLWRIAMDLVYKRRAAELTCVSLHRMLEDCRAYNKFSPDCKDLQLQHLEMEIIKQKTQVDLIHILEQMQTDQKIDLLFTLIDTKKNNRISAGELARILHLLRGNEDNQESFQEALRAARLAIVANDSTGDGLLELHDFVTFIESISLHIQTTKEDIVDGLIMDITTFYDEKVISEEAVEHCSTPTLTKRKKVVNKRFTTHERVRLYVLFQFIDGQDGEHDDHVMFNRVIEAMAPVFKMIDKEFSTMLFFGDYDEAKFRSQMDFNEFKELIDNAMGACPSDITVDHIANAVTCNLSRDKDARETYDKFIHEALSSTKHKDHTSRNPQLVAEGGLKELNSSILVTDPHDKMLIRHLFNLWDTSQTESLDVLELFMGFRKFQKSKKLDETLSDVLSAMKSVQENSQDGRGIELDQFEEIIVDFATEINVDVHYLVEYMYYQTIVVRNHSSETRSWEAELDFVKKHGKGSNKGDLFKFFPSFDEFRKNRGEMQDENVARVTKSTPGSTIATNRHASRSPSAGTLNSAPEHFERDGGLDERESHDDTEGRVQDGPWWVAKAIKFHFDNLAQEEVKTT
eukprot:CAMPEP_0195288786 /NCGR_PEP_ID=MMETSP0707-20130614/5307_1 /TAXON_ID=33640 /ORGANISM="Asterionellopsis glacialis, Strain CCMP134" /LENGTH=589 /DNA_ID=CAMNT_0040348691 /DNA_START=58 /DNA_END=1827 /DNA_ORIENTATION=-